MATQKTSLSESTISSSLSSVGTRSISGAAWTLGYSVLYKFISLSSQILLAWLLLPADFGLASMALSIASVASMVSSSNLRDLLVQRYRTFDSDATDIFWLALSLNSLAGILMVVACPFAVRVLGDRGIVPLIEIMALTSPVQALPTVYMARLYSTLQFRLVAKIQFRAGVVNTASTIVSAVAGAHAFSFAVGIFTGALYTAIAYRRAAGRVHIGRPTPAQWPVYLAPALWLMLNALFMAIQNYGSGVVIGFFEDKSAAGIFFWGAAIATQAVYLLAINLRGVFFPALNQLNSDEARQSAAFRRATQGLICALAPICLIQALLATDVIRIGFATRWLPAAPVISYLSLGVATQPYTVIVSSLLLARGRNRLLAILTGFTAVSYITALGYGASTGTVLDAAKWSAIAMLTTGVLAGLVGYRQLRCGVAELVIDILPVLVAAAVAATVMEALKSRAAAFGTLPAIVIDSACIVAVYSVVVRILMPQVVADVLRIAQVGIARARVVLAE